MTCGVLHLAIAALNLNPTRTRALEEPLRNKWATRSYVNISMNTRKLPLTQISHFFPAEMTRSINSRSNICTDTKIKSENLRIVSTVVSIEGIFQWHFQYIATVNIVSDRKLLNGCSPGRLQWNEWHSSAGNCTSLFQERAQLTQIRGNHHIWHMSAMLNNFLVQF